MPLPDVLSIKTGMLCFLSLYTETIACPFFVCAFWLAGSKPVFMSFSDTQCLFLDVALLVEILKGSLFLHLINIVANTVHS